MISLVVPGVPAPQGSKNQFGGEANPRTRPWRAAVTAEAALTMRNAGMSPLTGPVEVRVTFAFPRPKSHYGTGRNSWKLKPSAPTQMSTGADLDKLQRSIGDALTDGGVLRDDRQIARWEACKIWDDRGYAAITITELLIERADIERGEELAQEHGW